MSLNASIPSFSPAVEIVIPTYNERDNLSELVQKLMELPPNGFSQLRLRIVDDNSPDGTGAIADELAKKFAGRVFVLHRANERGRAGAEIAGFKQALADADITHVGVMDADFSHRPEDLPALIEALKIADIAIGSRYARGGKAINCALMGRARSIAICKINKFIFGLDVNDNSGGYKIYARRALEAINLDNYLSWGYSVGVETLLKCKNHGFSMKEVPITFINRQRGESKLDRRVLLEYPLMVLRLKLEDARRKVN